MTGRLEYRADPYTTHFMLSVDRPKHGIARSLTSKYRVPSPTRTMNLL